jgi:hypothetical protein
MTPSIAAMPLGDVGDPPQPENSVASVAPEAAWQAPAQNRRRETTDVFVSDIVILGRRSAVGGQYRGRSQTIRFS